MPGSGSCWKLKVSASTAVSQGKSSMLSVCLNCAKLLATISDQTRGEATTRRLRLLACGSATAKLRFIKQFERTHTEASSGAAMKDSQARATAASVCLTLIPALAALVTQLPCINAFTDVQVGNIMVPSQQVNSIVEKADVQATSQSPEKALQILHAHHRIAQLHHCQPNWVHIVDCVYDLAFHCIEKLI